MTYTDNVRPDSSSKSKGLIRTNIPLSRIIDDISVDIAEVQDTVCFIPIVGEACSSRGEEDLGRALELLFEKLIHLTDSAITDLLDVVKQVEGTYAIQDSEEVGEE